VEWLVGKPRSRFTFHQCGRCWSEFEEVEGGEEGKDETMVEAMYTKKKNVLQKGRKGYWYMILYCKVKYS
jgi:hypothetical protein